MPAAKRKSKPPSLLVVVLLIAGLAASLYLVQTKTNILPKAFFTGDINLAGQWDFERGPWKSGVSDVQEIGGRAYGTTYGIVGQTGSGKVGNAAVFDGLTSYIEIPDWYNLRPTQSVTVMAYINPLTLPTERDAGIVHKGIFSSFAMTYHTDGYIYFYINEGDDHCKMPVRTQTWQHIAGTYDKSKIRCYLDGVEVSSLDYNQDIKYDESKIYLGKRPSIDRYTGESYFRGMIDEVKIYNGRALSASELYSYVNPGTTSSTSPGPSTSPTASKRVFVTSGTWSGHELEGTSGADYYCQYAANSANLGGAWKSSVSVDPSFTGYKLVNGQSIGTTIEVNEFGQTIPISTVNRIWITDNVQNCNNWTTRPVDSSQYYGMTRQTYDIYTKLAHKCDANYGGAQLLCFEQ